MLGSAVLDTAIGIVFIFFVISTIVSSSFSLISNMLKLRGKLLQEGLIYMLDDDMRRRLMNHPLVRDVSISVDLLNRKESKKDTLLEKTNFPSYIPSEVFSTALIDIIIESAQERSLDRLVKRLNDCGFDRLEDRIQRQVRTRIDQLLDENEDEAVAFANDVLDRLDNIIDDSIRESVIKEVNSLFAERRDIMKLIDKGVQQLELPKSTIEFFRRHIELLARRNLRQTSYSLQENYQEFKETIENWFNNSMDNLSNIFKARAQMYFFFIATVVVLFLNINALAIAETLWTNPTVRATAVEAAANKAAEGDAALENNSTPQQNAVELSDLEVPMGWTEQELERFKLNDLLPAQVNDEDRQVPNPFNQLLGWIIAIGAAMRGAPFWFDILNKIVNIRTESKPD